VSEFQKKSSGPATIGELSGLAALKAQMEADEATSASSSTESDATESEAGGDEDQDDRDVILHESDDAPKEDTTTGQAEDVTKEPEFEGPNVETPEDVKTMEMMDQPADEAVADAIEEQNDEEKEG
jgi:hypothetical protein